MQNVDLVRIGLFYMACPNGRQRKYAFLLRLKPDPVKGALALVSATCKCIGWCA